MALLFCEISRLGITVPIGRGAALGYIHENIGQAAGLMGFIMVFNGSIITAIATQFGLVEHHQVGLAISILCAGAIISVLAGCGKTLFRTF